MPKIEKDLGQDTVPLYGIISASGGQWTVTYRCILRKDKKTGEFLTDGCFTTKDITGYGDFPKERYPDIPVIDYRAATSEQIMKSLNLGYNDRPREEAPYYNGILNGFLDKLRSFGIVVI